MRLHALEKRSYSSASIGLIQRASIGLSQRPEPSGDVVHVVGGEVDGLDIGGQQAGGLFFCATLTSCRVGHTPFVQAGAKTSDTGVEAVKPDHAVLGRVIPGVWVLMLGMKVRNLAVLCNHFVSAFHRDPRRSPHVCCCYQIN